MDLHKDFVDVRGVCFLEHAASFDIGVNLLEDFVDIRGIDFLEYAALKDFVDVVYISLSMWQVSRWFDASFRVLMSAWTCLRTS
jgi:hypothetical protein